MSFKLKDVTIITVHYNTLWLLKSLYKSIRQFYNFPILVVDNCTNRFYIAKVKAWYRKTRNVDIIFNRKNIGHGPGIHLGINNIKTKLALCIDTDVIIKKTGFIEKLVRSMASNSYGAGMVTRVNRRGICISPKYETAIPYLHPHFMLLNINQYRKYKPVVNHGAPMLNAMIDIKNKGHRHKLLNIRGKTYYKHLWHGTEQKK